jgi:hypothetical protein
MGVGEEDRRMMGDGPTINGRGSDRIIDDTKYLPADRVSVSLDWLLDV